MNEIQKQNTEGKQKAVVGVFIRTVLIWSFLPALTVLRARLLKSLKKLIDSRPRFYINVTLNTLLISFRNIIIVLHANKSNFTHRKSWQKISLGSSIRILPHGFLFFLIVLIWSFLVCRIASLVDWFRLNNPLFHSIGALKKWDNCQDPRPTIKHKSPGHYLFEKAFYVSKVSSRIMAPTWHETIPR